MGMYSTYIVQDIEVIDAEGLKKSVAGLDTYNLVEEGDEENLVDFSAWDNHKIEGYWYDETKEILHRIAPYIKGFVEFSYEEGWHFRIVFEKGKPYFQKQPIIDWEEVPKTLIERQTR